MILSESDSDSCFNETLSSLCLNFSLVSFDKAENTTGLCRKSQSTMTYSSRGRTMTELILAVIFIGFLTGFVAVMCIGNYVRAKRAMERQRQRRLAHRLGQGGDESDFYVDGNEEYTASPRSNPSSASGGSSVDEHMHLLAGRPSNGRRQRIPELPRRRVAVEEQQMMGDLLLSESTRQAVNVMSV